MGIIIILKNLITISQNDFQTKVQLNSVNLTARSPASFNSSNRGDCFIHKNKISTQN